MKLSIVFSRLGLPTHSAEIYSLLSRRGSCLATTIAKEARIHRPALYRALRALLQEKFVRTELQGRRHLYYAAPASLISSRFKSEAIKVSDLAQSFSRNRTVDHVNLPGGAKVFFLSGPRAISEVFDDVVKRLNHGETFYRYTSERDLSFVNQHLSSSYRAIRDKKKLERLVISNPRSAGQKRSRLERFIRTIPQGDEVFSQNIIQLVYGSRIAIIDLTALEALIIEHRTLADFQKNIFRSLYKKLDSR
jgi:sugar-specific transcriptional regulator TrmB